MRFEGVTTIVSARQRLAAVAVVAGYSPHTTIFIEHYRKDIVSSV